MERHHVMMRRRTWFLPAVGLFLFSPLVSFAAEGPVGLRVQNGWYVHNGKVVWGYAQHNGWWRAGQRANITRNAPGQVGPNRTEDLDKLTDAMLRYGYPGFEHNFGLWYDRRRDQHDTARREDAKVVPPFLEQPWARTDQGTAWDGLPKYDLTKYNDWYFGRLKQFAEMCDRKGTVLLFNFYMQHALLETNAHYVDFPWRPANCFQQTGLPDHTPAANAFYDVSHPLRRKLHQAYIRKCLDELGGCANVVFLCSEEYTGPADFMRFWLDTIIQWEQQSNKDVHIALSGCKDVVDALLSDRQRRAKISTIDLRYWWYEADGLLFAPKGGQEVPGRYIGQIKRTTAPQIYRQVKEYRLRYPDQAIIHGLAGTRQHAWAALMGGASMLVGQLPYPDKKDPSTYISPELCRAIQPTYDFIRAELAEDMPRMRPRGLLMDDRQDAWCLADANDTYLVYTSGGDAFRLDLSEASGQFQPRWFDPRTGRLTDAARVTGGAPIRFTPPSQGNWPTTQTPGKQDWVLLVRAIEKTSRPR